MIRLASPYCTTLTSQSPVPFSVCIRHICLLPVYPYFKLFAKEFIALDSFQVQLELLFSIALFASKAAVQFIALALSANSFRTLFI